MFNVITFCLVKVDSNKGIHFQVFLYNFVLVSKECQSHLHSNYYTSKNVILRWNHSFSIFQQLRFDWNCSDMNRVLRFMHFRPNLVVSARAKCYQILWLLRNSHKFSFLSHTQNFCITKKWTISTIWKNDLRYGRMSNTSVKSVN